MLSYVLGAAGICHVTTQFSHQSKKSILALFANEEMEAQKGEVTAWFAHMVRNGTGIRALVSSS